VRKEIIDYLSKISEEEQDILDRGDHTIRRELHFKDNDNMVIKYADLLKKGRLIDINVNTRFAYFPLHKHDYIEMTYVVSGEINHIMNMKEKLVQKKGDLLFLNKRASHELLPAGKDDIAVNFLILPDFFQTPLAMFEQENLLRNFIVDCISGENNYGDYILIHTDGIIQVENLLENMIYSIIDKNHSNNFIIQSSMGLLFSTLSLYSNLIGNKSKDNKETNQLITALKYIEDNYKNGTLSEISDKIGCPTYYISRLLKKHTGNNFKDLLQKRKLRQAAHLLESSTIVTDEIIAKIGYENSSYFYRCFKKEYGMSPKEYRKLHSHL